MFHKKFHKFKENAYLIVQRNLYYKIWLSHENLIKTNEKNVNMFLVETGYINFNVNW